MGKVTTSQLNRAKKLAKEMQSKSTKTDRENVEDWLKFSLNPQKEEDIRKKLLDEIEEEHIDHYVCLSYVCRYSKLSEEFIEELIKITTFKKRVAITKKGKTSHKTEMVSRLDWKNICQYQKLSEEFIERHKNDVLWDVVYNFQDLSDEFKKKHIEQYTRAAQMQILSESGEGPSASDSLK